MPLTPADVHNVAFKKPAIGKRGYDGEDVDAFLDEVERELVRLLDENHELRGHLGSGSPAPGAGLDGDAGQRVRAELAALRSRIERAMRDKADAEQAATQMQAQLEQAQLEQAQFEQAQFDQAQREGSRTSGFTSGDSPSTAPRVLLMAQRTADEHVNDARREADSVLVEARAKAEQTMQEAIDRAATVDREARERHQQAVQSLGQKRSDLLREISGLAGLAEDYRNRLREALTAHLLDLETVPASQ